jgi:HEAT repeat protein
VRAEARVGDATRRRQYSIALKRMYNKGLLEAVAEVASHPSDREASLLVLRRAGEDGVEVLLDLLVAAPTVEERRAIFVALTGMKEGTDQLVHMLGHHQWFVVRNVAELAGELGLEEAVPALGTQLDHEDERVRKAVALALAKIGSSAAAEPLRRALRDKSPEVRIQAAIGVGGRKAAPLAMPLVAAMEEEKDEAVERELMLALGRIGSAAAVQALIKFAQPGGRLFGRKSAGLRTTAVEALRLAATPAAVGTLEGLTDDGDKHVRAAAQGALGDLKRK